MCRSCSAFGSSLARQPVHSLFPAAAVLVRMVDSHMYEGTASQALPAPDFTAMRKDDLMAEAKSLGVHTRQEITKADGTKHRTWRPTADVAVERAAVWERHQHPDTVQCARHQTAPSAFPMATTDLEIQSQLPS